MTCARCDDPITANASQGLCTRCAAKQRGAAARLLRLRPMLDRISGALAAVKKLTTLDAVEMTWRGPDYGAEYRALEYHLTQVEAELDLLADEWTILLLNSRPHHDRQPRRH